MTDTATQAKTRRTSMADIRRAYLKGERGPGEGRHWFDRQTMRHFGTRLPRAGWTGPGGTFFAARIGPDFGGGWKVYRLEEPGRIVPVDQGWSGERGVDATARGYAEGLTAD